MVMDGREGIGDIMDAMRWVIDQRGHIIVTIRSDIVPQIVMNLDVYLANVWCIDYTVLQ